MSIGYACLTVGVENVKFKTCRKANASDENLLELIKYNLNSLNNMLDYNIKNGIHLLRISSDIIPFGSHPVNGLRWWEIFRDELFKIGQKAKDNKIRLSMHPGQYTVINSKTPKVVENSINDLIYHNRFLDSLNLDKTNKLVLHIGGAYGDKEEALKRFRENYKRLDENIKNRLVIENDDKIFNICELLDLGKNLGIPVIYDNLHNEVNPCKKLTDNYWIKEAKKTWKKEDGRQKIHYSQQNKNKKTGSHSETIDARKFYEFYNSLDHKNIDIMLEVKDKNLSAIKINNLIENNLIVELEKEWARYKYLILELSPRVYNEIRKLLKDKSSYPVLEFYDFVDEALSLDFNPGYAVNAGQHIWGYFKNYEENKSKEKVENQFKKIKEGSSSLALKRILWKLSHEKNMKYLLDSLYFKDLM